MKTTLNKRVFAAVAFLSSLVTAHSQSIQYDGILTGADGYTGSQIVTWFNGHDDTTYGDFNSQFYNTTLRYGVGTVAGDPSGTKYFFLYADVPLEAKNMVWGAGMTALEISQYGKQLDFSGATGSEKFMFLNSKGDDVLLVDFGNGGKLDKSAATFGLLSFKDSVQYLLGNGISTTSSSAASTTKMSIELQFALDPTKNAAILAAAKNGLDIHLSPDRGLIPPLVPEPSTTLLFGLLSAIGLLRRKR